MRIVNGTYYNEETAQEVVDILEKARRTGKRIRMFYGDPSTGRDWCEEHGTMGTIGRSTGSVKVPLIINNSRSLGGPALLDAWIVRITIEKKDIYKNKKYYVPEHEIRGGAVFRDDRCVAHFKDKAQAERYVAFIKGDRNSK